MEYGAIDLHTKPSEIRIIDAGRLRARSMDAPDANADVVARRLMTAPGVGPVLASACHATIGDVGRFARPGAVVSFRGLVPREDSSGERQRKGAITNVGPSRMRVLLFQSAWHVWRCARGSAG